MLYFQQGDIPTQGQYADLIDSQLNLNDGGTQILSGSISASNFISSAGISLAGTISSSGNLEIGNITSSAGVSIAGKLTVASAVITDITGSNISASLQLITDKIQQGSAANGINITGHITASGNISASGTITGDTLVTNNFTPTHITASGNISASGDVIANTGSFNHISASGDIIATNLTAIDVITSERFVSTGQTAFGDAATDTHTFIGNITASNNISASGRMEANRMYPQGKSEPFISTIKGQIQSSTGFFGASITASSNISASGALIGSSLTLGGTAVTSTAAEINYLDGVLSNVKEAYDTVANLSQGVIRFTELDNETDTLTLTSLSPAGAPTFVGVVLTKSDSGALSFGGNAESSKNSFHIQTAFPQMEINSKTFIGIIVCDLVATTSVIIANCNINGLNVFANIIEAGKMNLWATNTGEETILAAANGKINIVIL